MKAKWVKLLAFSWIPILGIFLVACQDKDGHTMAAGLAGEYLLLSVNGQAVPASVSHGGVDLQVLSGYLHLRADGTCSSRTVFVPPGSGEIVRDVDATFTADGSTVTLQWQGAGTTTGTVDGDTFTMDNEGMIFVYRQ